MPRSLPDSGMQVIGRQTSPDRGVATTFRGLPRGNVDPLRRASPPQRQPPGLHELLRDPPQALARRNPPPRRSAPRASPPRAALRPFAVRARRERPRTSAPHPRPTVAPRPVQERVGHLRSREGRRRLTAREMEAQAAAAQAVAPAPLLP